MSNKKEVLFLREEYGEGRGKYTYPHGEKYEGEWEKGKYHGQGTKTFLNGDKYIGEFKKNEPWNISVYDKNGNLIEKVVNGEWIEQ